MAEAPLVTSLPASGQSRGERLIVRMAKENSDGVTTGLSGHWPIWVMTSAIKRLAVSCSATVYRPRPERKRITSWPAFIRTHLALLAGPLLHRRGSTFRAAGWSLPGSQCL